MAVYVDALKPCLRCKRWPYDKSCHLVADDVDELHAFAARLGLKRAWYQDSNRLPHYDLTAGKRVLAVCMGAAEANDQKVESLMLPVSEQSLGRYRDRYSGSGPRRW